MKDKKIWTIVSIIILVLQAAAEALLTVAVFRLNILPEKYLIVLLIALVVFLLGTAALMLLHKTKPVGMVRRIIAWVVSLLVIAGCVFGAILVNDAYQTIHKVTENLPATSELEMYVFVRNDDPAQSLSDAKGYSFGIIQDYDTDHTQQAIAVIGEAIGEAPVIAQYASTSAVVDALFGKQADAVILNGAMVALLMEESGYEDFMEKARILHTMALSDLEETEPTTEATTIPVDDITNTPFIVYISGSDTRNKKLKVSRSDVNILVVVNPETKQVLLLNTPRDYYVANPKGKGRRDKLTNCGLYGINNSMKALGKLYDLEVDYYAHINFTGFETLVDAVGGITVTSNKAFEACDRTQIVEGENFLNGEQALDFARERHHVKGGDNGRGKNQMKVITALIHKLTTGTTIISNYSQILESLQGMFKTDVTTEEISLLVKMQLTDLATWNVQSFAVTGTGSSSRETYSSPGHNTYIMLPNKKVVKYASELVDRVLAGEILTKEDMTVPKK